MNPRDSYHHGDLRTALVAEGLRRLETEGLEGLSLRALAKAAGVSPNAPYRHFADKNALWAALAAEGFQIFAGAIETAGEDLEAPLAVLRAQGFAYLEFARTHPALFRLMFSPLGYSLHSEACGLASARAFSCLTGAVARAQERGWKPDLPLSDVTLACWSAFHGWATVLGDGLVPAGLPPPSPEAWMEVFFASS